MANGRSSGGQVHFNKADLADEVQLTFAGAERVDGFGPRLIAVAGDGNYLWTWKDAAGGFLRALQMEDNIIFVIIATPGCLFAIYIDSGAPA